MKIDHWIEMKLGAKAFLKTLTFLIVEWAL
jgi:hypothetical protein